MIGTASVNTLLCLNNTCTLAISVFYLVYHISLLTCSSLWFRKGAGCHCWACELLLYDVFAKHVQYLKHPVRMEEKHVSNLLQVVSLI